MWPDHISACSSLGGACLNTDNYIFYLGSYFHNAAHHMRFDFTQIWQINRISGGSACVFFARISTMCGYRYSELGL